MTIAHIHTRRSADIAKRREIRDLTHGENASAAIGTLTKGCEIFGWSQGQFSLIHVIIAMLEQTGPAHVSISTWTAATSQIDTAYLLLREQRVKSLRWFVDYSFPIRQPAYCARLRALFGDESIRLTKNHAKFVLIRNDQWDIVLRSSMNLNVNARFELFDISDDRALADFLTDVIDGIFDRHTAAETFDFSGQEHCDEFERYGIDPDAIENNDALGINLDDPKQPGMTIQ